MPPDLLRHFDERAAQQRRVARSAPSRRACPRGGGGRRILVQPPSAAVLVQRLAVSPRTRRRSANGRDRASCDRPRDVRARYYSAVQASSSSRSRTELRLRPISTSRLPAGAPGGVSSRVNRAKWAGRPGGCSTEEARGGAGARPRRERRRDPASLSSARAAARSGGRRHPLFDHEDQRSPGRPAQRLMTRRQISGELPVSVIAIEAPGKCHIRIVTCGRIGARVGAPLP